VVRGHASVCEFSTYSTGDGEYRIAAEAQEQLEEASSMRNNVIKTACEELHTSSSVCFGPFAAAAAYDILS